MSCIKKNRNKNNNKNISKKNSKSNSKNNKNSKTTTSTNNTNNTTTINVNINNKTKTKVIKTDEACMRCYNDIISYVRDIDYTKLPPGHFHPPDIDQPQLLTPDGYQIYQIYLPNHLYMTQYPYKVCETCYNQINDVPLQDWNFWKKI